MEQEEITKYLITQIKEFDRCIYVYIKRDMFRNIGRKEEYTEKLNVGDKLFRIEWDYEPIMKDVFDQDGTPTGERVEDDVFASWMQETYTRKPELNDTKNLILDYYNKKTDKKILTGFKWVTASGETIDVYLSTENQFNYKAAYDLAYQTNGASLPFRLKFGKVDNPEYHDFNSLEEFTDFYYKCIGFINQTLQEGWETKDSIDWSKYDFS